MCLHPDLLVWCFARVGFYVSRRIPPSRTPCPALQPLLPEMPSCSSFGVGSVPPGAWPSELDPRAGSDTERRLLVFAICRAHSLYGTFLKLLFHCCSKIWHLLLLSCYRVQSKVPSAL